MINDILGVKARRWKTCFQTSIKLIDSLHQFIINNTIFTFQVKNRNAATLQPV